MKKKSLNYLPSFHISLSTHKLIPHFVALTIMSLRQHKKVSKGGNKELNRHKKRQMSPNGFLNEPIWNVEVVSFTYYSSLPHFAICDISTPFTINQVEFRFVASPPPTHTLLSLPLVALMISIWLFFSTFLSSLTSFFAELHKRETTQLRLLPMSSQF